MKISSYHSAFNLISMNFDYKSALDNYCNFFDEVVVAVNTSKDDTLAALCFHKMDKGYDNLKIVECDFSYDDLAFDGKIKNFALQHCMNKYRCLLDFDERVVLSQRHCWDILTDLLSLSKDNNGFLIPSIDLVGDIHHYKCPIGYKFYLHDDKIRRGIVNYAKISDTQIDITKSDTCDAILENGELGRFLRLDNRIETLKGGCIPYIFHYWAVDLDQRIRQNEMWKKVWENRAGREVNDIILNKEKLEKIEVFEHGLPLE
jgi:hypothetical protein